MAIEGSCLCGETKIKVDEAHEKQVLCHCTDCSHTSGTGFSANILADDSTLTITGPITEYVSSATSGNKVTRVFCSKCGSSISHKSTGFGPKTAVHTGNLLETFKNIPVAAEIFTKDRWTIYQPVAGAGQLPAGM